MLIFCDRQDFRNPKSLGLFEHNRDSLMAAENCVCLITNHSSGSVVNSNG